MPLSKMVTMWRLRREPAAVISILKRAPVFLAVGAQHLDGHLAPDFRVAREVDGTHATFTQAAEHFVTAYFWSPGCTGGPHTVRQRILLDSHRR
jgi:hypothetical protein